jgi:hypothetical protein
MNTLNLITLDILDILTKYDLPVSEYIVLSGASMVLQGIKPATKDIDISVSPELNQYLLDKYDCVLEKELPSHIKVWYLNEINFSTNYYDVQKMDYHGIYIQTLESILELKRSLGREKDFEDMRLIQNALKKT